MVILVIFDHDQDANHRETEMSQKLYEQDFYAWTLQQAELLRSQTQQDLDWASLAEELEDMGKNLKREFESRLKVLFAHLLKWQYQPSHRGHSWQ